MKQPETGHSITYVKLAMKTLMTSLLVLGLGGCQLFKLGEDQAQGQRATDAEIEEQTMGAGGRDVTEHWAEGEANTNQAQMLSYRMLRSEVKRATGLADWQKNGNDQWALNAYALGNADYKDRYQDNRLPDVTKMTVVRDMAMDIAKQLVSNESKDSGRSYFTHLNPSKNFDANSEAVTKTIKDLYKRILLTTASEQTIGDAKTMLDSIRGSDGAATAWQSLIAGLLSSTQFMSY